MVKGSTMTLFRAGRGRFCPFRAFIRIFRPSLLKEGKQSRDLISKKRFAKLAVIGSILSLSLYLIPHSIMVSPFFSIGLFILIGLIFVLPDRLMSARKDESPSSVSRA